MLINPVKQEHVYLYINTSLLWKNYKFSSLTGTLVLYQIGQPPPLAKVYKVQSLGV